MFFKLVDEMENIEVRTKIELSMDELGFSEEELDTRIMVLGKILDDLEINSRRYYTRRNKAGCQFVNKPDIEWADLTATFIIISDEEHAEFAKYLYRNKMELIRKLRKMCS